MFTWLETLVVILVGDVGVKSSMPSNYVQLFYVHYGFVVIFAPSLLFEIFV